ncbi:murein DD-endopeptidase MepM/ murein hydrolase activator NlpD [Nitrospina gracilis]|uniref:M23 family metallopeptidase n=1 Tax=Nitrospina TaxID=35800 RepID=UPI001F1F9356|nr:MULTISPECIES: M23 family metallopeptidase [Nitrospina]MCF8724176.1 murein DD-endopeptidase MepM/ murein hydrolase activator NlpD [Nitrospina sp. Nb-3]
MVDKEVYTIVVFPEATEKPKRFQIPKKIARIALYTSLVLAVGFGGAFAYLTQQFLQFRDDKVELAELKRKSKIQKVQIEKFGKRVRTFETEMSRLENFEKKLRIITALDKDSKPRDENWGVGGPHGLSNHSIRTALDKEVQAMLDSLEGDLNILTSQAKLRQVSFQELDEFFKNQRSLLASTPSIWPTRGWVTSGFGYRKSPFTGLPEKHEGLDIASRKGSEIRATADGKVITAGRQYGYGNLIEIDHGYGVITRYGHNSKNLVKVGDKIERGDLVALVGNTGRSTGPHVHYEIIVDGIPVNPRNYILED